MLVWLWLRLVGRVPLITKFGRAAVSKNTSGTFKHDLILTKKKRGGGPLQVKNKLTDAVLCLIFRIYSADVLLGHRGGNDGISAQSSGPSTAAGAVTAVGGLYVENVTL